MVGKSPNSLIPRGHTMNIRLIASLLVSSPELADLDYSTVGQFCDLAGWLRDEIAIQQPSYITSAPPTLPPPLRLFLRDALALEANSVIALWNALRHYIWKQYPSHLQDIQQDSAHVQAHALLPYFLKHGRQYDISESRDMMYRRMRSVLIYIRLPEYTPSDTHLP